MSKLVRPRASFISTVGGRDVVLGPADILRDTNAHVLARPDMFEEVRATFPPGDTTESATARPGEKSAARRAS